MLIIQVGWQRAKVTNTELADKILLEKAKYIRLASISFPGWVLIFDS